MCEPVRRRLKHQDDRLGLNPQLSHRLLVITTHVDKRIFRNLHKMLVRLIPREIRYDVFPGQHRAGSATYKNVIIYKSLCAVRKSSSTGETVDKARKLLIPIHEKPAT